MLRIGFETMLLAMGSRKLSSEDYFLNGAWRPGLSWAERRCFVGTRSNLALNLALNPPITPHQLQMTTDKLISGSRFLAAGLPMPVTKAVAAINAPGDAYRWLAGPEAMLEFLREPGSMPCFGKPVHGSIGFGAVRLEAWADESHLRLGDGRRVPAAELVAEIWKDHSQGYLFVDIAHPHPDLAALIGPVIGTLRVVTVDPGTGPEVLYVALKTPAPDAMVDSAAGPLGGYAIVDHSTGRILREQNRRYMGGVDLPANAVTGRPIVGEKLPCFSEAIDLALRAHGCLTGHGILGIDIMLTGQGPLLNEANRNPFHSTYQIATARGLLNPDLLPQLRAVRARFRPVTPRPRYCPLP